MQKINIIKGDLAKFRKIIFCQPANGKIPRRPRRLRISDCRATSFLNLSTSCRKEILLRTILTCRKQESLRRNCPFPLGERQEYPDPLKDPCTLRFRRKRNFLRAARALANFRSIRSPVRKATEPFPPPKRRTGQTPPR